MLRRLSFGKILFRKISLEQSASAHACMRVVAGLIDTPHMRHEVARKRHENAECGSGVEVAEQRNHA